MRHDPGKLRALLETARALGQPDRSAKGREVDYKCPFCLQRGYSRVSHLHVNYEKNCALCHQCGGWKDLLGLVRALYGEVPSSLMRAQIGEDFVDALRAMLARRQTEDVDTERAPIALPPEFVAFGSTPPERGMGAIVWRYLTGPPPDQRGLPPEFLEEIGAGFCADGRYGGYAIFPVFVAGVLVTFTSRRVVGVSSKVQHGESAGSRYAVFNYDPVAQQRARRVFIGEGPFDGWAFHRHVAPDDGGVALLGKVLHDEQCRLLDALPCEELCVCLDDTEHQRTMDAAAKLARLTGKQVSYILLNEGNGDPHKNRRYLPWYVRRRVAFDPVMTRLQTLLK